MTMPAWSENLRAWLHLMTTDDVLHILDVIAVELHARDLEHAPSLISVAFRLRHDPTAQDERAVRDAAAFLRRCRRG